MSFVTSSTEDTSVKNALTDSSLLQFIHAGKIADNHILFLPRRIFMRIFGLIALYAVALFLTGWLLLRSTTATNRHEQVSSFSYVDLSWSESFPSIAIENRPSADTTGYFSTWRLLPVGLVRYPDFVSLEFLKNGN
jgi:hypothetical protein